MILFRPTLLSIVLLLGVCLPAFASNASLNPQASSGASIELPDSSTLRGWIEQMKQNRRGPFKRIRWFCNDGSILPPEPYACREHGGGVQHGEWTDRVKLLRQNGYLIGTLLADLSRDAFYKHSEWKDRLKQIILEQFMREANNGWIFRNARFYRGAMQAEDENRQGRALLLGLLEQIDPHGKDFLLLREAVRFLPHGQETPPLTAMRQLSQQIAEQDPGFKAMRVKLHSQPEPEDATQVRHFAETGLPELGEDYQKLAELIDEVTQPKNDPFHEAILLQVSHDQQVSEGLTKSTNSPDQLSPEARFSRASQLLVNLRDDFPLIKGADRQLQWLDLSLGLEQELYRSANQLLDKLPSATRRTRLAWIEQGTDVLYGTGTLSKREHTDLNDSLQILLDRPVAVDVYHRELSQLARLARWAENRMLYHFGNQVKRLVQLDKSFQNFIPERLRSGPLLQITQLIDSLVIDSQQLRGISQSLFGKPVTGLQPLNPGIARGRLEIVDTPHLHKFSPGGIYLLPETVEYLPPVAGILTRGAGNALSHVQLLARNLGIPNISVSEQLLGTLVAHQGESIRLAASPGGVVEIVTIKEEQPSLSGQQSYPADFLIEPDLEKLYLQQTRILGLDQLSATDSGRISGPKGANLGELRQLYGELVPDALVIPFGRFSRMLKETTGPDERTLFDWMRDNYRQLAENPNPDAQKQFLDRLRESILLAPLDQDFLVELRTTLEQRFGSDGSYGVFVRSDTNVEDLPNFTGAGLNRTVPHVVGFDNIVKAIRVVWASPFSDRAYSWRQAHMSSPKHLYASVLLMLSVPAEKSGVMATIDPTTGDQGHLHVAVNEGVGGAVGGQRAEEILINKNSGKVRLVAQASAAMKRILLPDGGIRKIPAEAPDYLLTKEEIEQLRKMADELPARFPELRNPDGSNKPADIEFGFLDGRFVLFQIRPLVQSKHVRQNLLLQKLDAGRGRISVKVDLHEIPEGVAP